MAEKAQRTCMVPLFMEGIKNKPTQPQVLATAGHCPLREVAAFAALRQLSSYLGGFIISTEQMLQLYQL